MFMQQRSDVFHISRGLLQAKCELSSDLVIEVTHSDALLVVRAQTLQCPNTKDRPIPIRPSDASVS